MTRIGFVVTLLALLPAAAQARDCGSDHTGFTCCSAPVHWSARHTEPDARLAITTESGQIQLVLTDDAVSMQLSDRVLHKIRRKMRDEQDDDNALAQTIRVAVLSSVRAVLDHSAEVSIDDIRDVDYQHGRLRIFARNGERLFENTSVDDRNVMADFSDRDAREFVREFRRLKAGY